MDKEEILIHIIGGFGWIAIISVICGMIFEMHDFVIGNSIFYYITGIAGISAIVSGVIGIFIIVWLDTKDEIYKIELYEAG